MCAKKQTVTLLIRYILLVPRILTFGQKLIGEIDVISQKNKKNA